MIDKKKRDLFKKTVGIGAVAAGVSSLASPAISQGRRELKLVTTWPKGFPGLGTGAQRFADRVTASTGGIITIKLYGAGELVPAFESHSAVQSGSADLYHGADYYWVGKSKGYAFFTGVPMGLNCNEHDAWVHHGGGQKLWDTLGAEFNMKHLMCGNTGVQMGGWFNKSIDSIDDLKGLKMRIPGLGGEVINTLGATAVTLPGGEIFPALQSGTIDATEWVGPWNDLAFGFYKVTKFYYLPGFHEPSASLGVGINLDVWNSLSKEHQNIIQNCATAENNYMYSEFNARNADSLDVLVNKHGVKTGTFPREVKMAIGEASGDVMSGVGKTGGLTTKIYNSYIDFRKKAISWTARSETSYAAWRNLPFKYVK